MKTMKLFVNIVLWMVVCIETYIVGKNGTEWLERLYDKKKERRFKRKYAAMKWQ